MPGACRVFFSSENASLADGSCVQSSSVFSAIQSSTNSGEGMGVISDPCSPQEFFFCVGCTCAVIKTSLCERVETHTCADGKKEHPTR